MAQQPPGLPRRQSLVALWLLLSGAGLLGGLLFASWLDIQLQPAPFPRLLLWLGCLSGGLTLFGAGLLLERYLFTPLRRLHAQLSALAADPDICDTTRASGWLGGLEPDLKLIHDAWRDDRRRLAHAHDEGARAANQVRRRLESILQHLHMPLLICDRHSRLLMCNPASERLFDGDPRLGLGKCLTQLLTAKGLHDSLQRLPEDGDSREFLVPHSGRWLHVILRQLPGGDETLLTLHDATSSWGREFGPQAELGKLLPCLRQHGAGLTSAADALAHLPRDDSPELRRRLEGVIDEEGAALGEALERLDATVETLLHQGERLVPLWSNDFWAALGERQPSPRIVPVGMPAWFKGDAPVLIEMLACLLEGLAEKTGNTVLDAEICLGNRRVYLDLCWPGQPLPQPCLDDLRRRHLERLPSAPTVDEVLRQHASDLWSLGDGDLARLRLPLPALVRVGEPRPRPPRPEFHDFDIAGLPLPGDDQLAHPLRTLEVVAFDTETTGLALHDGDTVISLGACRLINARLLADDSFDRLVDPGRPIPEASTLIHGLSNKDVEGAPQLMQVLPAFGDYIGSAVLLAHNAAFDLLALRLGGGFVPDRPVLDTLLLSRALDAALDGHDLDSLAERYGLQFAPGSRHTALGDARASARLWLALLPRLEARGITTLGDAIAFQATAFGHQDACS